MTLQQLRYIVEVSKCSTISKAAQSLFLTQPTLSKAIKDLEEELGICILERGSSKTRFTAGLARGLGITADVSSPTFSLVHEYRGESNVLYHFDMYRISTFEDLCSTGFYDYLDWGGVLAVEWSENIELALPEEKLIKIEILRGENDDSRILCLSGDEIYENSWR